MSRSPPGGTGTKRRSKRPVPQRRAGLLRLYPPSRPVNRRWGPFVIGGRILGKKQLIHAAKSLAAVALVLVLLAALALTSVTGDSQAKHKAGAPVPQVERPCKKVTPKVFNKRVKILDRLTGKRHHKANRKVCKSHFKKLGKRIERIKRRLETDVRYAIRKAFAPLGRVGEALSVAYCESSNNRFSINASNHAGLFQLSTEHQRYLKFGPWYHAYSNAYRAAEIVRADGGWRQWSCRP